jgi:cofilin
MADINYYADLVKAGELNGNDLSDLVKNSKISKLERRKIMKEVQKSNKTLTERQKLRLSIKEKKKLPKISKEERLSRFKLNLDGERLAQEANFTICLGCRKRGHFLKDCPKVLVVSTDAKKDNIQRDICFNCGSVEHILKNCSKPREKNGKLIFANCFICKKDGHISKDCPENPNGLYPRGGCCHICLLKTHLVKDCPERTEEEKQKFLLEKERIKKEKEEGIRINGLNIVTDDNRDDFIEELNYGSGNEIEKENEENNDEDITKKQKKEKNNKKNKKRKLID